jgi:hypothetical protein
MVVGRRNLKFIVTATLGLVLLTSGAVFADGGCSALATASAGELLTIPERGVMYWVLPISVKCTWQDLDAEPAVCRARRLVIQDRMLDPGHRLIVSRPNKFARPDKRQMTEVPDQRPWDSTSIYACMEGRVKVVYAGALHAGGSIAPVAAGKFIESDSYLNGNESVRYQKTLYWHQNSGTYTDDPVIAPPAPKRERMPCDDLEHLVAARIVALATDGLLQYSHGFGIYDDGEYDVTLAADRMFGVHRRLIAVRRNHLKGAGVVDDQLVFACLSGSIRLVFQVDDVAVREATEDKLVVYSVTQDPRLRRWRPIRIDFTYVWNAGLADYVLTKVDSRPPLAIGSRARSSIERRTLTYLASRGPSPVK